MAGTSAAASAGADAKIKVMVAMKQMYINGNFVTSYSSGQALDWILTNIINCDGGPAFKFFLIHVQVHKPSIRNRIPYLRSTDEWSADDRTRGQAFLTGFETRCTENRIEFAPMLKRGCPGKEICAAVKEVEPDLLVLGNRGLGAFRRLFVTSVSGYCAKHAECTVIRIKRNAAVQLQPNPPVEPNPADPVEL